jgi:hypothetical protein
MKKNYFKALVVLIGLVSMTLSSCKKSSSAADDSISAQDANNVTNAVSSTSDDAASAAGQVGSYKSLSAGGSISLNTSGGNLLIDATITDTSSTGIVISYAGINACNGILRSGTITITNTGGIPWHEPNAQLTVTYNNLKVTEVQSGYSYTLNGTHTITNETGGLAWQVVAGLAPTTLTPTTTVTHRIQSTNMTITFPNGSQSTWSVDRTRSWSNTNSVISVSVYSEHSGNVAETGSNRFGDAFSNTFLSPVTANSNCLFRPYTGEWEHQISNRTATLKFGTNPLGTSIGTPTYCGSYGLYGYYITYTNGTITLNRFVSYWR